MPETDKGKRNKAWTGKGNVSTEREMERFYKREVKDQEINRIKRRSFENRKDSPIEWLYTAWTLKRAAEEIDTFSIQGRSLSSHKAKGGDAGLLLLRPVYRLLMGLSFENLLKGIIIAHGKATEYEGKLDRSLKTHNINKLLDKLGANKCPLSEEEKNILKEFTEDIVWTGRYPIPKDEDSHQIVIGYSSKKHPQELKLWERLSEHLKDVGYIKLNDGVKINYRDYELKNES